MNRRNRVTRYMLSALLAGLTLTGPLTVYAAVSGSAATPVMNPPPKTFTDSSLQVKLSCATNGATIRYTTNGNGPTSSSAIYTGPLTLTGTTTLMAKSFKTGMNPSATAIATYTKQTPTVATPVLSPTSTIFAGASLKVTVSCTTKGATICYTTNGKDPTVLDASTTFNRPIAISGTTTLRVKAFRAGMNPSATAVATYTKQVPPPAFKPNGLRFTFDMEEGVAHDGKPYFPVGSTHKYYKTSGVTIGVGYDMGSLKPIMVENALIAAGSDPVVAKRLSGGAGLKGDQAVDFCKKNGGLKITQKQGMKLYRQGYPEYVARAEKWVGKPAVWNALDQKMRDVLVDLFYVGHNGTNNTNLAGKIADSVASNNVGKFKTALSALSEKFPGYESRFQSRISYLDGKYPFRTDLGWTD